MKKKTLYFLMFFVIIMLIMTFSSCENNAKIVPVNGVALNHETLTLVLGTEAKLEIIISPENATNKEVIWNSSDEEVVKVSAEGLVSAMTEGTAIITVSTLDGDFSADCEVIVVIPTVYTVADVNEWNIAVNSIRVGGNDRSYKIYIEDNFYIPGYYEPTFGEVEHISVTIKGSKIISLISSGSLLYIGRNQRLYISDVSLEGYDVNNAPIINVVGQNSILTLLNNTIIKSNGNQGIYIAGDGSELIMYGGHIFENDNGGVLIENNSRFIMYDGHIYKNGNGGKLLNNDNIYTNHVEKFSKNISFGGVAIGYYSVFFMYGGAIYENSAEIGAGVYSGYWGMFSMYGGTISENISDRDGGGVNIGFNSSFSMHGGNITKNSAQNGGGVSGLHFNMYGGIINENIAIVGGGVSTHNFFISDGIISNNIAIESGGGVLGYEFLMSGGIISGNYAGENGGGVHALGPLSINPIGQTILGNVIIYGSLESGVPANLANSSGIRGAALSRSSSSVVIKYINGTDVLPHCDGHELYTDYTVALSNFICIY